MPVNEITVHKFSVGSFFELMRRGALASLDVAPRQAEYIARYCERLGVHTVVREAHYMDRHYVDEFALYYSRMLSPPTNAVSRLHFFAREFTEDQFLSWLERSFRSAEDRANVEWEMSQVPDSLSVIQGYLGFCSIRPIPSVPIGRTVLASMKRLSPKASCSFGLFTDRTAPTLSRFFEWLGPDRCVKFNTTVV